MAYDPQKSKNLLSIVGAFASSPGGDFIADLANQLREAEKEIQLAASTVSNAERDRNKATTDLETAQQTVMRLKSGTSGYTEMRAALDQIAKSSRGAQKIAADTLAAIDNPKPAEAAK